MLVNIVSGQDDLAAYGDTEGDQAHRYARTREFMQLVRRLWTEEDVTFDGEHFQVSALDGGDPAGGPRRPPPSPRSTSAARPRPPSGWRRPRPTSSCSGASRSTASASGSSGSRGLTQELGREHAPLEFGLRITTFVRDTTEQAWADAEAKVAEMAGRQDTLAAARTRRLQGRRPAAAARPGRARRGARRQPLHDPGRFGGGGAGTTWLVGSAEDVASSLRKYQELGITHFVLSDTPYLPEIRRQGDQLLPLLRS